MSKEFQPDNCLIAPDVPAPGAYLVIKLNGGVSIQTPHWTEPLKPNYPYIRIDGKGLYKVVGNMFIEVEEKGK